MHTNPGSDPNPVWLLLSLKGLPAEEIIWVAFVGSGLRRKMLSDFIFTERWNSFNISHPELICEETWLIRLFQWMKKLLTLRWLQVSLEQLLQVCHTCITYHRLLSAETSLDVTAVNWSVVLSCHPSAGKISWLSLQPLFSMPLQHS